MKKIPILFCALLLSLPILFSSCKKYEDGPMISLLTKKSRLCGEWKLESYTLNDSDLTSAFQLARGSDYVLTISKDETYKEKGNFSDEGTWKFRDNKEAFFRISSKPGAFENTYKILRLKNKSLWIKQTASNGDIAVIKYKQ